MSDAEFLAALETCALPPDEFTHAAHVRAGYLYLRRAPFAAALERLSGVISRFAAHHGSPDRYHETVTDAYLALIQQHLSERGDGGDWTGFARANPELFEPRLLARYYPPGQLETPLARRIFLLPRPAGG